MLLPPPPPINALATALTVRRKLTRSPSDYLLAKFKYLRAQAKQALKLSRKQYYDCLGKTMYSNPKRFWKLFKLNSTTSNIPQSVLRKTKNDQKVANNTISIAELFNSYFASTRCIKKVDKSKIAFYFVKRFNVRTFLLK